MRNIFGFVLILCLPQLAWAQAQAGGLRAIEQRILQEGLALYQSERSAWVATDLLMAQKPDLTGMVGYVSYADGDSMRTVFFQQAAETAPLLARYIFSFPHHTIEPGTGRQLRPRPASATEQKFFTVRRRVLEELQENKVSGTAYAFPENTHPNVAILEEAGEIRAYVFTGPQEGGVLPIGNDVLMKIGRNLQVQSTERLHSTYVPMKLPPDQQVSTGMHTHLSAHPYITATDICSLLLYQETFPVPRHMVVGREYVSLFDASTRDILILTKKAFEKMAKKQP
ncbi:hypothetical protein [Hymenobacter metallicola]|uniref:Uncharacterized protein n=1 Tax=Hymenobacter metallicola TaxID=2563114 RepID=A0A4Z0QE93_9BACT|nr:hypothetical protein [Hymenobacter metallicola]TGE28377.1 hypothetical protein E5K02_02615 [Hymenobacter metallicola]